MLLFAAVPLIFAAFFIADLAHGLQMFDFQTFWQSGRDVLHGHSPYPHTLPAAAERGAFRPFVYPAPAAVAMVPLALLPFAVANAVFAVAAVAAVFGALRLLDIADWRCYGAAFVSVPVFSALGNGAISPFLMLGVALLWRYRDHAFAAGLAVASMVAVKLFLWPLALWLAATRRIRATLIAIPVGVGLTLTCWAAIGFAGLTEYPALLGRLSDLVAAESFSLHALALSLGASSTLAGAVVALCGVTLLAAAVVVSRGSDGDQRALAFAVAASLALTPIVWPHYLMLAFVPLALARPRLSAAWLAPLPLWFFTEPWSGGDPRLIGPVVLIAAATLAPATLPMRAGRDARLRTPADPAAAAPAPVAPPA